MNHLLSTITAGVVVVAALTLGPLQSRNPVQNPDPNHTHADFAVWFSDQQIRFDREAFMSGSSTDATHERALHPYLHLHDGIGHVIHRHKSGLTLAEFFASVGFKFTPDCFRLDPDHAACNGKMYINGNEVPMNPDYMFEDTDKILLTYESSKMQIQKQLRQLTDDACLYSRTCPWRGDPPTENCIADPTVPCVVPE